MSTSRVALPEIENKLRISFSQQLYLLEVLLYVSVGILLSAAAAVALFEAGAVLWRGIAAGAIGSYALLVLDQLLLVLMLVEILHTIRISVRSKELMLVEPFLIVGLIASIRRLLVITLQASKLMEQGHASAEAAIAFRNAMIELSLLGFLVLVLVFSIYLMHRTSYREEPVR